MLEVNPLTPMSDQDRISPSDENKEKYQFRDN